MICNKELGPEKILYNTVSGENDAFVGNRKIGPIGRCGNTDNLYVHYSRVG